MSPFLAMFILLKFIFHSSFLGQYLAISFKKRRELKENRQPEVVGFSDVVSLFREFQLAK